MAKFRPKKVKINKIAKLSQDQDNKLQKIDPFLETQRAHQKWYHPQTQAKQRGKPKYDLKAKIKTRKKPKKSF